MRRLLILAAVALIISCGPALAKKPVKDPYATDPYAIGRTGFDGMLRTKSFYGSPNYGEQPETDAHEDEYVLIVRADPTIDERKAGTKETADILWLELVILKDAQSKIADTLMDQCVHVEGELTAPVDGHYHTPLALIIDKIGTGGKNACGNP